MNALVVEALSFYLEEGIASEPQAEQPNGSEVAADAPSYRCPKDCDPSCRPTSPNVKCNHCRTPVVPA